MFWIWLAAFGAEGRNKHGYSSTYIRRHHVGCTETVEFTSPDHNRAVRIAKNYPSPHVYQLVDEEEAALEHLLMNQHTSRAWAATTSRMLMRSGDRPGHGASATVITEPSINWSIS